MVSRSCSLRSTPALVRCARPPLLFAALTGREAAGGPRGHGRATRATASLSEPPVRGDWLGL